MKILQKKKINTIITNKEFTNNIKSPDNPSIRNKEEVYYYKVFKDYYFDIELSI